MLIQRPIYYNISWVNRMEQYIKKQVSFFYITAPLILPVYQHIQHLGLKTLVSLHQSDDDIEGLTEDEVHIIKSVLDLRERSVASVMTPIQDVFTLSFHSILDKDLVHKVNRDYTNSAQQISKKKFT